jgi:glycerophosphoryl diester phosphodiesterase
VGLRSLRIATPRLVDGLLSRSRASTLVLHHALVTSRAVERAHARGAAVVAWTVDDPRDLARVEEAGVDAVVTNDPSIFVSTLTP